MLEDLNKRLQPKNRQILQGYFDQLDDVRKVKWLLIRTRRLILSARSDELVKFDITPPEGGVLKAVHSIGKKATPMVISRWILKQPHTTSTLLDRMEKKGLIRKIKDLESSNQVRIELTQKGEEAHQKAMNDIAVKEIFSVLSPEELAALRESLEKVFEKSLERFQARQSTTSKYYF